MKMVSRFTEGGGGGGLLYELLMTLFFFNKNELRYM